MIIVMHKRENNILEIKFYSNILVSINQEITQLKPKSVTQQ